MGSVIGRVNEVKQPSGGYVNPSWFEAYTINDGLRLNENENVNPAIIGKTVDALTRFIKGEKAVDAFAVSYKGAVIAEKIFHQEGALKQAKKLLLGIKGLDDVSIVNACKLVTYDVWIRNSKGALMAKGVDETEPDMATINNIKMMVARSILFWNRYGPIVKYGFTFEPDGYTDTVSSGDGDYLTADTIWNFKAARSKPTDKNTLQLLMYWIMGQHSGQEQYKTVQKLGIFNPRLNEIYCLDIKAVSGEIIAEVEKAVICY